MIRLTWGFLRQIASIARLTLCLLVLMPLVVIGKRAERGVMGITRVNRYRMILLVRARRKYRD